VLVRKRSETPGLRHCRRPAGSRNRPSTNTVVTGRSATRAHEFALGATRAPNESNSRVTDHGAMAGRAASTKHRRMRGLNGTPTRRSVGHNAVHPVRFGNSETPLPRSNRYREDLRRIARMDNTAYRVQAGAVPGECPPHGLSRLGPDPDGKPGPRVARIDGGSTGIRSTSSGRAASTCGDGRGARRLLVHPWPLRRMAELLREHPHFAATASVECSPRVFELQARCDLGESRSRLGRYLRATYGERVWTSAARWWANAMGRFHRERTREHRAPTTR